MRFKYQTSAGGIVFKKERDRMLWLITQHSQHKGWSFPKGLVGDKDKNESKEAAALREVEEEGGIKVKIIDPEPVKVNYAFKYEGFLVKKTVYYYLMEYLSGDPKDHDWEVMNADFVTEDEVRKILSFDSDKKAFKQILVKLE